MRRTDADSASSQGPLKRLLGLARGAELRQGTFESVAGDEPSCLYPGLSPPRASAAAPTATRGIDLVLCWTGVWDIHSPSHVDFAWNWTRTSLVNFSQQRTIGESLGKPLDTPVDFILIQTDRH